MKIQYLSDLHLEFYRDSNIEKILEKYIDVDDSDILLLLGDIDVWCVGWDKSPIYNWFSENFKHTIYIPGNHEYYSGTYKLSKKKLNIKIKDNVYILNNDYIDIEGVRFLGSTLWTNIKPQESYYILKGMVDYRKIKVDEYNDLGNKLTIPFVNNLNDISKEFIFNNLSKDKNIVLTHHLPSYSCINDYYKGSVLNSAFANSDLDNKIMNSNIDYWIYGHSHGEKEDLNLNGTILSCNQVGYPQENIGFNKKYIIL
jgi:predicted phosphohydrolase